MWVKCKRCGRCCQEEVCETGINVYKTSTAPCPGLKKQDDIFSCQLIEIVSEHQKWFLFFKLGIGFGCDNIPEI